LKNTVSIFFFLTALSFAADAPKASFAKVFDSDLMNADKEIVSLAEAMPADKYSFAPTGGEFTGVRTFGQQMRHIAAVNDEVAAAILGEKSTVDMGKNENGPDSLDNKDAIVKFLKDSFASAHKAIATITAENVLGEVKSPFGGGHPTTRASLATILTWHSFDHYGQAVVYARMNGVVPPASKR
jgi:uncharacterized damage-inducible protein DinB